MGHGIHFYLARKQNLMNFDPPLTLAETASVFGELVMTQALLREERDLTVRLALLCVEIEDMIATVFRQNVLTRFEQQVYQRRRERLLSSEEVGDLWWQANAKLFGDSVEMIPEYRWGGLISPISSIPAFIVTAIFSAKWSLWPCFRNTKRKVLPSWIH
jgi:oligoendopeptidase F